MALLHDRSAIARAAVSLVRSERGPDTQVAWSPIYSGLTAMRVVAQHVGAEGRAITGVLPGSRGFSDPVWALAVREDIARALPHILQRPRRVAILSHPPRAGPFL
ncbi:hypothetical protein [Paracoccus shanxieyensis]|uniref:Uncharacterized protein n=1 Tax=Paracoccus shanxieyensis TaxID=2675752 RepID=A0A6L6J024_9RHOB|nr:hypothetical protein [Paracoccus shanxieyensis]MTH64184.1 hypothetical protein [Paracoccus shanxieyensis]MTH87328.1 hypothetical protein [Paracoccus shanxieyensis]